MDDHEQDYDETRLEHLDILEVSDDESFSQGDLKKRLRELNKQYHPDRLRNASEEEKDAATEKMKTINQSKDWMEQYGWDQDKWEQERATYCNSEFDPEEMEEILRHLFGFSRSGRFFFAQGFGERPGFFARPETRFERRRRERREKKRAKWSSQEQFFEHMFGGRGRRRASPEHHNIDFGADSDETSDDSSGMPDLVDAPMPGGMQGGPGDFGGMGGIPGMGGPSHFGGFSGSGSRMESDYSAYHDQMDDDDDGEISEFDDDSSSGSMPGLESMPDPSGRFGGRQQGGSRQRSGGYDYDQTDWYDGMDGGSSNARGRKKNNKAKRTGKKAFDLEAKQKLARKNKSKMKKKEKYQEPVMQSPTLRKNFENQLRIKWRRPDHAKGVIKQYILEMQYGDDSEPDWNRIGEFPADTTSYTIPDLLPGRDYIFRMKAIFNNESETAWSQDKRFQTEGMYNQEQIQAEVKTNIEYREIARKRREEQENAQKAKLEEEKRKKRQKQRERNRKKKEKKRKKKEEEELKKKRQKEEEEKAKIAKQRADEEYEKMLAERRKQLELEEEEKKRQEQLQLERALKMKELDEQQIRIQQLKEEAEWREKILLAEKMSIEEEKKRKQNLYNRPQHPRSAMQNRQLYAATAPWSCDVCTFENSVDLYWCEMCERGTNPRPSPLALSQKQAREAAAAAMPPQGAMRGSGGRQRGRGAKRGRGRGAMNSPVQQRKQNGSLSPMRGRGRRRVRGSSAKPARVPINRPPPAWAGNTHVPDNRQFIAPKVDIQTDFPTLPEAASWGKKNRRQKANRQQPQYKQASGGFVLSAEEKAFISGSGHSAPAPPKKDTGDDLSWLTPEERAFVHNSQAAKRKSNPPRRQSVEESSEESEFERARRPKARRQRQYRSRSRSDDYDPDYDRDNVKYAEPQRQRRPPSPDRRAERDDDTSSTPESEYEKQSGRRQGYNDNNRSDEHYRNHNRRNRSDQYNNHEEYEEYDEYEREPKRERVYEGDRERRRRDDDYHEAPARDETSYRDQYHYEGDNSNQQQVREHSSYYDNDSSRRQYEDREYNYQQRDNRQDVYANESYDDDRESSRQSGSNRGRSRRRGRGGSRQSASYDARHAAESNHQQEERQFYEGRSGRQQQASYNQYERRDNEYDNQGELGVDERGLGIKFSSKGDPVQDHQVQQSRAFSAYQLSDSDNYHEQIQQPYHGRGFPSNSNRQQEASAYGDRQEELRMKQDPVRRYRPPHQRSDAVEQPDWVTVNRDVPVQHNSGRADGRADMNRDWRNQRNVYHG